MNTKEYVEYRIKILNAQLDEPEVLNKGRISDKMEAYQEVLDHITKAENLPVPGVSEWRFLANEKPPAEGCYEVLDTKGQIEKVLYGCSGFMGEPVSFFDGKKVEAKDIIAFREEWRSKENEPIQL